MSKEKPFWETGINPILGYRYEPFSLLKDELEQTQRKRKRYARLINL